MEKQILLFFHKTLASNFLDSLMFFFTQRGYLLGLPVFFWMVYKLGAKEYKLILYLIVAITLGIFIADWSSLEIKNLIQRVRPCHSEYFRAIVGCSGSYSFPSNHSTNSLAAAVILFLFVKRFGQSSLVSIYIFSVALLICFSRIYLGIHWPIDVLSGALWGAIIGFIVFKATISINNLRRLFYFFLIVLSLFRIYFILQGPLDISPDESHYWEWSRRLDLSYYSKGPMIAYLIALSTWLFGDTPFGIRILAVVCSFLSSIFIYKIGKKLLNEKVGLISGIFFQIIPLFSAFGVIFTIDSPFILFWIISMYLFLLAIEGRKVYWLILGITIGLGLLTKYTMAFFYLCMFIFLIKWQRDYSFSTHGNKINIFKNTAIYFCILISMVVFSPVIIWNFQHEWVTVKHTAGQAHVYEGFRISLKFFAEFVGSQLLIITPLVFIFGLYFLLKPSALNLNSKVHWFFISFSLPVLIFFLLKSLHGKVQANWAMTAYIPFLLILAYSFDGKVYRKIILSSTIMAAIFTIISYSIPFINLPANLDPSSRLKGWKQLGDRVYEIKQELVKSGNVIIFSDRYQISSELAFYVKDHPKVYCINLGRRMNQYDLWDSINNELKEGVKINGIYVVYGKRGNPEPEVSNAFERCNYEIFTAKYKSVNIRDYTIFKCYNFKGMNLKKPESY